jgi:hypothetical protein
MATSEILLAEILDEIRKQNSGGGNLAASSSKLISALQGLQSAAVNTAGSVLNLANTAATSKVGFANVLDGVNSVANVLPGLGGAVKLLTTALTVAVSITEKNVEVYKQISSSGANFGGSLVQLRQAAMNTYMTMDEFASLMKRNSDTFSRMGGTVDDGARAFVNIASSLQKGKLGDNLRALGMTSEEVNQGLANYIAITGGRTQEELKNTKEITASAAGYMQQLDALAQITGKSRQQQEEALKAAQQNQAFQAAMQGMDEKARVAAATGLKEMSAKYGDAGRDLYMAQMMGIPPQTEAAKQLMALAPEVANASQQMANSAKAGATQEQMLKLSAQATAGGIEAAKRYTNVVGVMSFQTGATAQIMGSLQGVANQNANQGIKNAKDAEDQRNKILEKQKEREKSEAAAVIRTQIALQELGNRILNFLLPAFTWLTDKFIFATQYLIEFTKPLIGFAQQFVKFISPFISDLINNVIKPFFTNLFKNIMSFDYSPFFNFFTKLKDTVMSIDFMSILTSVKVSMQKLWDFLKAFWEMTTEVFSPVIKLALDAFTQIGNELGPVFKDLGDITSLLFNKLGEVFDWMKTNLIPGFKIIFEIIKPIAIGLVDTMIPFWNALKSIIKAIKSLLAGDFDNVGDQILEAGKNFIEGLKLLFMGLYESLGKIFNPSTWFAKKDAGATPVPTTKQVPAIPNIPTAPSAAAGTPPSPGTAAPVPTPSTVPATVPTKTVAEKQADKQELLNKYNEQILQTLQAIADYHKRTLDAIRSLNGNQF